MILLPVGKGQGRHRKIVAHASIDDADSFLTKHRWCLHSDGYVYRSARQDEQRRTVYLHREVMWHDGPEEVSHLNGNPLDNQSGNLEIVSNSLNKLNPNDRIRASSGYRGVTRDIKPLKRPWRGKVKLQGKLYCTARYGTPLQAATALNELRQSLGLPIDLRVFGDLPAGYGNSLARDRRRVLAGVKPKY